MHGEESAVNRRRQTYTRSQTLASLPVPLHLRTDSRPAAAGTQRWPQWLTSGPSAKDASAAGLSSRASIPGATPQEKKRSLSGGNVCEIDAVVRCHCNRSSIHRHHPPPPQHPTLPENYQDSTVASAAAEGIGGSGASGRRQQGSSSSFSSSSSSKAIGASSAGGGGHHSKRLGRTPSSPSVLLSKVKERIREKVFETSAEWPHMAAIVQERRQRAADAFEARMSLRRMHHVMTSEPEQNDVTIFHQQQQHRMRRVRIRSDPAHHRRTSSSGSSCSSSYGGGGGGGAVGGFGGSGSGVGVGGGGGGGSSSFDRDGARVAFRRRSISDDTFNQQRRTSCSSSRSSERGGIVCSDDDLRAIVYEHRLRR